MQYRFTLKSKGSFFKKVFPLLMVLLGAFAGNISAQCAWTSSTVLPTSALDKPVAVVGTNLYSFAGVENGAVVSTSRKFDGTTWSLIAPLPTAVEFPSAVSDGSNIFIMGGITATPQTTNYRYNVATNTYTTLAPLITGTWSHAAVLLNGKIYKIGGIAAAATNAVHIYDIATNTWTVGLNYPQNAAFVSAVADNGFIYAAGGVDLAGSTKTYRYDPVANVWNDAAIADLPATRWAAAQAFYRGGFVLAGGFAGGDAISNISATAISWDPLTNVWNTLPAMPLDRARMTGGILNDSFYVVGGRSSLQPAGPTAFTGNTNNYRLYCPPPPPCTGTPNPGNTIASPQAVCVGTPVTFTVINPTVGTGVTYQWETSVLAAGPWTNAAGSSTSASYTTTPSANDFYRLRVTCASVVGTSTPVQVTVSACTCLTPDIATICEGLTQRIAVNGAGIPGGPTTVSSGPITVNVPDANTAGITTPLTVALPAGASITSMSVNFNMTHTFDGDMTFNLVAPNGAVYNLVNRRGLAGDNFVNTTISSTSLTPISGGVAPFTGTFSGDGAIGVGSTGFPSSVATFSGLYSVPNGTWRLDMRDHAGLDFGILTSWSLTFNYNILPIATWSGPAGTIFSNAAGTTAYVAGTQANTIWVTPTVTSTYVATIVGGPCAGANNSVITVLPRPIVSITPTTGCSPLTITASGANTYAWTPAAGLNTTSGAVVIANPIVTTTYSVTGRGTNGCAAVPVTATVSASPTAAVISAVAGSVFQIQEGFTTVLPTGWARQNLSSPLGAQNWGQGLTAVFNSFNGAPTAYAHNNFNATTGDNTISSWMFTPVVNIKNGDVISFYTRTQDPAANGGLTFPDRLELRMSTNGASVNAGTTNASVGDFTNLLLTVNPTLTPTGYPFTWTKFTATVTGVTGTVSGKFAFRYFVTNGGSGANSDNIGVDQVEFSTPSSANCANVTTNLKVDVTGGVGPFTIVYTNGTTQTIINNYVSGSNIQVSPAVTTTYSIVSVTGANGCLAPASTGTATVVITPPASVTTQPTSQSASCGSITTFTAALVINAPVYQWQIQTTTGGPWVNLTNVAPYSGVTTNTLGINPVATGMTGYKYRLQYEGACTVGINYTNVATLTVTPLALTITPNPVSKCAAGAPVLIGAPSTQTVLNFTNSTPGAVADGVVAGISRDVIVTGVTGQIQKIRVKINATSNYVADLVISLKAPNGKIINLDYLLNRTNNAPVGTPVGFVNTIFNLNRTVRGNIPTNVPASQAINNFDDPFTAEFPIDNQQATFFVGVPSGPTGFAANTTLPSDMYNFSPLSDANGVWTLAMYDAGPPDPATFLNYTLEITYGGAPATFALTPTTGLFTNAAGTTPYLGGNVAQVYAAPLASTVYSATVTAGACSTAPFDLPVNIYTPVTGSPTLNNAATCVTKNASFTVGGTLTGGPGFIHQYQVSTDNGATYINVPKDRKSVV